MTNRAPDAQPRDAICRTVLGYCHRFPAVAAILGHSENAHRLLNCLVGNRRWSASEVTPGLLMRITDEELLEMRNVGPGLVAWFRNRMDRLGLQHSTSDRVASPVWLTPPEWKALVDLATAVEAGPMQQRLLSGAAIKIQHQMGWP